MTSHLTPKSQEKEWHRQVEEDFQKNKHMMENRVRESVLIEKRAESKGLLARMNQEMNELEIEEKFIRAREAADFRKKQAEQEERLAQEMKRIKDQEFVKAKTRQRLREESVELRDFESKLAAAYHVRFLDVQVKEKELAKIQERNRERKATQKLQCAWSLDTAHHKQEECNKLVERQRYRQDLQDQMIDANKAKQAAYQEFLRDKVMIDGVVRKIQEEDERELQNRLEKMANTQKDIDQFKAAQAVWKEKQRAELEEENRRVQAFMAESQFKPDTQAEERRKKEEAMDVIREKIGRQILEKSIEKRERELLLEEVWAGEQREAEVQKHQADIEKQLRSRIEIRETYRVQRAERLSRLQREESEEKAFMENLMTQMKASARVEQMTKQKQRTKQVEFRHEIEKQVQERRNQRALELQEIAYADEQLKEHDKARMQMIEEERTRMLKEHADKLFGYIPPGVLRESDLALLGPEFVATYGPRDSNDK